MKDTLNTPPTKIVRHVPRQEKARDYECTKCKTVLYKREPCPTCAATKHIASDEKDFSDDSLGYEIEVVTSFEQLELPLEQRQEKGKVHDSDCSLHNMPAYTSKPCDCSVSVTPEATIKLPECSVAAEVMKITAARAATGMKEYGVTLAENDSKTDEEWLDDVIEELLDACNYIVKFKKTLLGKVISNTK